jgi:hypothetical protein
MTALIAPYKATMAEPKLPGLKTSQPSLSPKQSIPHISSYKEAPLAPYNITVNNGDTLEISSIVGNKTYSGKLLCSDGNIITGTFVEDSGVYSPQGTASRQIIQTGTEEIGTFKWHSN